MGLIIGLLWLLRGQAPVVTWEQQNRDAILTLKDEAEQLAVDGDNQRAYEKYQELERMVSGQTITDPYLQQELARSWVRKDSLYDLLTAAKRGRRLRKKRRRQCHLLGHRLGHRRVRRHRRIRRPPRRGR